MRFELIYADPPWQYSDRNANGKRGACFKYDVMPLADILALPVARIAAPDCLLAMWWTGPLPGEALATVEAWGFTLKNMAGFTWHKLSRTGRCDHFGTGHWTRSNSENVLLATKGHPRRACNSVRGIVTAPITEHSAKPAEVRRRLELLMGDVPRVELFARVATPGWTALGYGLDGRNVQESIPDLALTSSSLVTTDETNKFLPPGTDETNKRRGVTTDETNKFLPLGTDETNKRIW